MVTVGLASHCMAVRYRLKWLIYPRAQCLRQEVSIPPILLYRSIAYFITLTITGD